MKRCKPAVNIPFCWDPFHFSNKAPDTDTWRESRLQVDVSWQPSESTKALFVSRDTILLRYNYNFFVHLLDRKVDIEFSGESLHSPRDRSLHRASASADLEGDIFVRVYLYVRDPKMVDDISSKKGFPDGTFRDCKQVFGQTLLHQTIELSPSQSSASIMVSLRSPPTMGRQKFVWSQYEFQFRVFAASMTADPFVSRTPSGPSRSQPDVCGSQVFACSSNSFRIVTKLNTWPSGQSVISDSASTVADGSVAGATAPDTDDWNWGADVTLVRQFEPNVTLCNQYAPLVKNVLPFEQKQDRERHAMLPPPPPEAPLCRHGAADAHLHEPESVISSPTGFFDPTLSSPPRYPSRNVCSTDLSLFSEFSFDEAALFPYK